MNKLYLSFQAEKSDVVGLKIPYWDGECPSNLKEDCNIHLYKLDSSVKGFDTASLLNSAKNPLKHTIFYINPKGLEFYQLDSAKKLAEELSNLGAFIVQSENIKDSIDLINSISRQWES